MSDLNLLRADREDNIARDVGLKHEHSNIVTMKYTDILFQLSVPSGENHELE